MQGVFIKGQRPKSKKAIKDAIASGVPVRLEATSLAGSDYDGLVTDMPEGTKVYIVGPDPYNKRNFYGSIQRVGSKIKVT